MQNTEETSLADLIASEQFQRYCLSPSQADMAYWEQWQQENPDQQDIFEEAKSWVLGLASQLTEDDIKAEFQQVLARTTSQNLSNIKLIPLLRPWMGIAAGILLLCAALLFWQANSSPAMISHQTDFGETQQISLADGSQLMLNANSTIRIVKNKREVWLEGEGFFEVAHDPAHPFLVHTAQGDIKVLGTRFNAYQRDGKLKVTLIEGKVNLLLQDEQEIEIKPGEQVTISQESISHDSIDTEPIIAWRHGHLLFRDATIQSIIERLKIEFNWDIVVKNPDILDKRIHAVIHQYDPEVLLNALAEIYDLNIEKLGEGSYEIR